MITSRVQEFIGTSCIQFKTKICFLRLRHFWKNMDCDVLRPPNEVRGMLKLDREKFNKAIQVPRLWVKEEKNAQRVLPAIKKFLLKMEKLKPVKPCGEVDANGGGREILLHPLPVKKWNDLPVEDLAKQEINEDNFGFTEIHLNYDNWKADEILKSVLPEDEEGMSAFSRIGHIVHLNLKDHLLAYKDLIGHVLLDKVANCKTVVNKAATIDNTYRNFHLDLLCGEPKYQVETKENGVMFEFDFSKVYWNPRLATEHGRIVDILKEGDVLYDIFAGVGPFSVPAAKRKCHVLANDLNPESFKWLQHNIKRNKCIAHAQTFNKDGREFIKQDVKLDLMKRWQSLEKEHKYKIHMTMNLPALAVEFLSAFRGLMAKENQDGLIDFDKDNLIYPLVHVYSFAKGENTKELVLKLVEDNLQMPLKENLQGVHYVRNVAPNKDMYRVSFYLTKEILTQPINETMGQESASILKRQHEEHNPDIPQSKIKCL